MRPDASRAISPARLCAFNFGLQTVWGAILAVSLQTRTAALSGGTNPVLAYAWLAAGGALIGTVVQVVAGRLSDARVRTGRDRRAFYAAGTVLSLAALGWFYLAGDFVGLAGAFALLQIGMNVASGPYQAVIPDYVPAPRRGVASSWMSAYQQLGGAAGLVVAAFVHDVRFVALALGGALGGSGAVVLGYLRERRLATPAPPELPTAKRFPDAPSQRAPQKTLVTLLLSRGLINCGFYTLLGFLLFFIRESLGVAGAQVETQTGLVFLTFTLAAVPGAVLAAKPADRLDKRLVIAFGVAAIVAALALLVAARTLPLAYAGAALAGAGWGAFVTADWALAASVLPAGAMATAMGIWNVATTLPQIVAPLLTAPLVLRLDAIRPGAGPRGAILLAIVEFAAGAILVRRLPRA